MTSTDQAEEAPVKICTKCHEGQAGPGGILCPDCKISIATFDFWANYLKAQEAGQ